MAIRRSGTVFLTSERSSTLPHAIAAAMITVPANKVSTPDSERGTIPTISTSKAIHKTRSVPWRCALLPTSGDVAAKASSGKALSSPAAGLDKPVSCSTIGSTEPTPVSGARSFAATNEIPTRSNPHARRSALVTVGFDPGGVSALRNSHAHAPPLAPARRDG